MLVSDVGPYDADVMLVGEAPGAEEEQAGRPFVGAAGKILRQMLSHAEIDYNKCFVTNVMNTRPPGNKFKYFYSKSQPSKALENAWRILQDKVEKIRPKVVVPLGAEPLKALCNKTGIANWRGTWLSFRGINVLPTYHPAYILRVYRDHPIVELDLRKAASQRPSENPPIVVKPGLNQVLEWLSKPYTEVSFDIETIGRNIRCLGFAGRSVETGLSAICIPFIKFASSEMVRPTIGESTVKLSGAGGDSGSYWTKTNEVVVLDAVNKFLSSSVRKFGQNSISFDAPLIMKEFGIDVRNHFMDTMHAWHCLYPELPMGLSFLCSVLTNYRNYWTEKDDTNDLSEWTYNAMDCVVTLEAGEQIYEELKESSCA